MPKVGSHNAPVVEVELRFDRVHKTYVQQLHGPNRTKATNADGTKVYEFEASYPTAAKTPAGKPLYVRSMDDDTERLFKVWQLGNGAYALVQPTADWAKGGDVKHIVVKDGVVKSVTLDDIRTGFGMAAKPSKSSATYAEHNPQALRF